MYLTMKVRWWYWYIYIYWWYLKIMKKTHQHENHKTRSFRHFQSTMAFRGFPWRQLRCWRFGQSMAAGSRHVLLQSSSFVGPAIGCQHRIPAKKTNEMAGHQGGWGMVRSLYHGAEQNLSKWILMISSSMLFKWFVLIFDGFEADLCCKSFQSWCFHLGPAGRSIAGCFGIPRRYLGGALEALNGNSITSEF